MIDYEKEWVELSKRENIIEKKSIFINNTSEIYLATNKILNQYMLLIKIPCKVDVQQNIYSFKGVDVAIINNETDTHICICLIDKEKLDIFISFVKSLMEVVIKQVDINNVYPSVLNYIMRWKTFFDKVGSKGLSLEAQKGLLGEVLFIDYLLSNEINSDLVITGWAADEYSNNDFLFENTNVEVKFTSSKKPHINITSEKQLEEPKDQSLYLFLYTCTNEKNGNINLNSAINKVRTQLMKNINAQDIFNQKLLDIGYIDDQAKMYESRYNLINTNIYHVHDNFPRITSSNIPEAISQVSYSIGLTSIERYITTSTNLIQKIK